ASLNACEFLHVAVPWREVIVANWPVDSNAFLRIRLEVPFVPSIAVPAPEQRTTTNMISAIPIESFLFHIRAFLLIRPHAHRFFIERVVSLQHRMILHHLLCAVIAVRKFPNVFSCIYVIL